MVSLFIIGCLAGAAGIGYGINKLFDIGSGSNDDDDTPNFPSTGGYGGI